MGPTGTKDGDNEGTNDHWLLAGIPYPPHPTPGGPSAPSNVREAIQAGGCHRLRTAGGPFVSVWGKGQVGDKTVGVMGAQEEKVYGEKQSKLQPSEPPEC